MTEINMRLEDWLDDLCVRFIVNLPREELESVERICFQVEEAQWFYEDFIRPLDPNLPSLKLREFALRIFQHCPLMSQWSHYHHSTAFSEFLAYKTRVPVRGAILLNQEMDEVVLVKGWKKGANWSFPRGKINKEEKDLDCAVREVYEETGFDIRASGLIKDEKNVKYIEIPMREQNMRLYVLRGVPKDTHFEPRTRKEISKIEWYKLSDLPTLKKNKQHENVPYQNNNKFYMVATFLGPLKKWIAKQRKLDQARISHPHIAIQEEMGGAIITEDEGTEDHQDITEEYPTHPAPAMPILPPVHSDLPEVSAPLDPTVHLKRLLNIGPAASTAPTRQSDSDPQLEQQHQHISNIDKGNALLQLLRKGSETHPPENPPIAPIPVHPSRALPTIHSQQTTPQPTPAQVFAPPVTQLGTRNQYPQHPQNQISNQPPYTYSEQKPAARPRHEYVGQVPHQLPHEPAKPPFTAYPPPLRQIGTQPPTSSTQHGIAKSPRSPRREKKHTPSSRPSAMKSNIKILPRPTSNNNEGVPVAVKANTLSSAPRPNVKLSEITKPFKPKILRRPDKDNLEAYLPTSTVTVSAFSKPEPPPVSDDEVVQKTLPQPQFDQRPSQSAAQKETLLSLFNKDLPPQSTGIKQDMTRQAKSPVLVSPPFSTLISPTTDPLNSPREATRGGGSERRSGAASPSNQAFLIGYLEDVATGKK
ncbi:decapping enzyme Dcp2 [Trichophyton equinum CBS 127.97]|uniref:Decapping enzyme Dcp2 n=1 Tax=Trichophyton equinum (strain ATCC MYA-4606 / CBS 127.97) TaxID=559882 RepID=F2Q0B1_TRIEC|nr:decapping enzyme Dcp2 [Trichophyton equinum CBS 127.97]